MLRPLLHQQPLPDRPRQPARQRSPPSRPRPAIASALLARRPSPPTPAMAPRLGGAAGVSGVVYKGVLRRDGSVWAIKEVLKINVKTSMSQKALQVNPPSHPPPTHTYHPPHPTSAPPSPPSPAAQPSPNLSHPADASPGRHRVGRSSPDFLAGVQCPRSPCIRVKFDYSCVRVKFHCSYIRVKFDCIRIKFDYSCIRVKFHCSRVCLVGRA